MKNDVHALILAGGRGSRMAAHMPQLPKPLMEVGGMALVEMVTRQVLGAGVKQLHFALGHRAGEVMSYLQQKSLPTKKFHWLVEKEPRGTIGALAELAEMDSTVLAVNGDLVSGIDLAKMLKLHKSRQADITIATHTECHRLKLGEVVINERGAVGDYLEKPTKLYRISSGTYLFEPRALRLLSGNVSSLDLPSFIKRAIKEGLRVFDFHHDAPWIDVNDAGDLERARRLFESDPKAFGFKKSIRSGAHT